MKNIILLFSLVLLNCFAFGQNGTIRGLVVDDATGETLVGATVLIVGTTTGTISDLDGKFSLDVPSGKHQLQISYISYQTIIIDDVLVTTNQVTQLNNLRLKETAINLQGVVISAQAMRNSEAAIQTIKKNSPVIIDGISSDKMQLIGDATAVEAAKRVTGVSVEEGKYVFIRGLGDRYSKTTLNGMDIPGLDPDRNSLQMDIFPTNLIDNIIVSKNFTADMPADFTGGIMNVEIKDFPEERITSVSLSTSFNPDMHFNSDYLTYNGGATDFLGFDDGTRALPAGADKKNIPTPISGHSEEQVVDFIRSFNPELGAKRQNSLLDYSASFSTGNQISLKKSKNKVAPKLGYIFSLSYKSDYTYYDDVIYSEYQRFIDPDKYEMRYATMQNAEIGERNVLLGFLGGLAYKTQYSKIRFTALHLQSGQSRAAQLDIDNNPQAPGMSGYFAKSDNLEYNQRSITNILINGKHVLQNSGWEIDWRASPTFSTSYDPDIRKTAFTYISDDNFSFMAGAGGNPSRIWRSLDELNISSRVDIKKDYSFKNNDANLKFGVNYTFKRRNYEIMFFDIQFYGSQSWTDPDPNNVLDPGNLYPNKPNSIYYQSGNNSPNPNAYESDIQNRAFYVSNEFFVTKKLKTILGIRAENYLQWHTGRDQAYASGDIVNGRNLDNEKVLESFNFFPSVNLIYALTGNQNLRFSFTQTIARPSFKELSFAQIIDPITNRIYNGSLFVYGGTWDGKMKESNINNVDFRWELFLSGTEVFSVSGFYKDFANPIELVRIPEQQTSTEYQPRNVGDGLLYGVELEFLKKLDFISSALENFSISSNFTYVDSRINMTDVEYNSRKAYEKIGESISDHRVMAGQAPYMLNSGFTYKNMGIGLDAGLYYNVKGPVLLIVGGGLFPDIYQLPFHSLNFSINKKIGANISVDFKVSNLLNDRVESVYQSYKAEDKPFDMYSTGRAYGLGVSYRF
jgi:TonB-dependent receptor